MLLAIPAAAAATQATKPGAPTNVTVAAGNKKVVVKWEAPKSDGGSPITGYVVTPTRGKTKQPPLTFNSTDTNATVSGLANGASYTFKVAAINAAGTGAESAASASVAPKGPGTKAWYQQKRYWAAGLVLLIAIGVVIFFAVRKPKKPATETNTEPTPAA